MVDSRSQVLPLPFLLLSFCWSCLHCCHSRTSSYRHWGRKQRHNCREHTSLWLDSRTFHALSLLPSKSLAMVDPVVWKDVTRYCKRIVGRTWSTSWTRSFFSSGCIDLTPSRADVRPCQNLRINTRTRSNDALRYYKVPVISEAMHAHIRCAPRNSMHNINRLGHWSGFQWRMGLLEVCPLLALQWMQHLLGRIRRYWNRSRHCYINRSHKHTFHYSLWQSRRHSCNQGWKIL